MRVASRKLQVPGGRTYRDAPLPGVVLAMLFAALAGALAGCATPPSSSYVVLLANDDGTTGKVLVSGRQGETLLETPRQATAINGRSGNTFTVADDQIARDFGAAMAARPKSPITFLLYFETGGATLTAESRASVPLVLGEIKKRAVPDISIVGHTDTVGKDHDNAALGMLRARFVAMLFDSERVGTDRIAIESHGEKNPLVPTPDNTAEPRNRRAEVTVR